MAISADSIKKAAEAFKQKNWYNGGTTATPTTETQNLAAVINQPGNTTKVTAQPYISANGATDYHISGMPAPTSGGGQTTPTPPVVTPTQQPIAQPVSAQQTQSFQAPATDYAALAAARTSAALAQKRTIAQQQKASADTAYNQQNLRTKDDRILGDFSRTQTATPFDNMGRKSFQEGLIGRERTQADADASSALATQKANIDGLLAAYENATADEQVRIADELERADRSYKLDLAKFERGNFESDRGFDQSQQVIDYNQNPNNPSNVGQVLNNEGQALTNQLNELKIGNYPTEVKQQAQLFEQQVKSGQMSNEAAAYNLKELTDPKSATNQAKALDLQMKQLEAKNLPETERLKLQQLKKTIAEIGVTRYKPQTDAEKAYDLLQVEKITQEISNLKNKPNANVPQTVESYSKYLGSIAKYTKDPETDADVLANPEAVEREILNSGLSDDEMIRLYHVMGLKTGK